MPFISSHAFTVIILIGDGGCHLSKMPVNVWNHMQTYGCIKQYTFIFVFYLHNNLQLAHMYCLFYLQ